MSNKEVEFKFQITKEQKELIQKELNAAAEYLGKTRQVDTYYVPKFKSFELNGETMECLRIREVDDEKVLGYKKIHREANPVYCDEYELKIADKTQMEKILFAIDFEVQMVIDKTRESYKLGKLEFDFDTVLGLGELLEVELKDETEDVSVIFEFLKPYGLDKKSVTYKGIQTMLKEATKKI